MPKISDLVDQAFGGDALSADTASLKQRYGGNGETSPEAARADASGLGSILAGLDPTNPSNLGRVLPMGLQMGASMLAGPEAGAATRYVIAGGASILDSILNRPQGGLPQILQDLGIGLGTEGLVRGAGKAIAFGAGKPQALRAGEVAATEAADTIAKKTLGAEEAAARAEAAAGAGVETAQGGVNREIAKHADDVLSTMRESEVEKLVEKGLGAQSITPRPVTIENLTQATAPVQKATQKAVSSVFGGISAKWNAALSKYDDLPVQSTLSDAVDSIRQDMATENKAISASMSKLLTKAEGRDVSTGPVSMSIGRNPVKFGSYATTGVERTKLAGILAGKAGEAGLDTEAGDTVKSHLGIRDEFSRIMREGKNPTDRRIASRVVDAIDNDVQQVVPEEAQAQLKVLRDEWHQARSTFSNTFRSRLFRASSPEQVAEALYTGAKTGKTMSHRASLAVNQMAQESPEDLPLLRQSFASMISSSPDKVATIEKMEPSLFKSLFPGTGFDDPKEWTNVLRGQQKVQTLLSSPEGMAKFNSAFQQGMGSLGTKAKQAALDKAEQNMANLPGKSQAITEALKGVETPDEARIRGGMEAMKQPMFGKGMSNYLEHRLLYHGMLSMGIFAASHNPMAWGIPLAYLGGSKAMSAALSNPKFGRMYYNALMSDTVDKMGFWFGRLASATLSQGIRSASSDEK